MKSIACWLLSLVVLLPLCANNNLRHWNLTDGSRIHAELVEFDETGNQVYLRAIFCQRRRHAPDDVSFQRRA